MHDPVPPTITFQFNEALTRVDVFGPEGLLEVVRIDDTYGSWTRPDGTCPAYDICTLVGLLGPVVPDEVGK